MSIRCEYERRESGIDAGCSALRVFVSPGIVQRHPERAAKRAARAAYRHILKVWKRPEQPRRQLAVWKLRAIRGRCHFVSVVPIRRQAIHAGTLVCHRRPSQIRGFILAESYFPPRISAFATAEQVAKRAAVEAMVGVRMWAQKNPGGVRAWKSKTTNVRGLYQEAA